MKKLEKTLIISINGQTGKGVGKNYGNNPHTGIWGLFPSIVFFLPFPFSVFGIMGRREKQGGYFQEASLRI